MEIEFYGAADGVTGSLHRLRIGGKDILLDCGLFQGRRAEANHRNRSLPEWAKKAHALVLSHAHIDHSGNIPSLVRAGFQGNIYCSPPTRDLCSVMLRDAAMILEQDANYLNRRAEREHRDERIEPIYSVEDAQRAVELMISLPLERSLSIAPGVNLTFYNAGHVLGSSLVVLDLEERGVKKRLLFSGDLGRKELPLLSDPAIVKDVDAMLLESTYGNRLHADIEGSEKQLAAIVRKTIERGGKVLIPSFALERAQEILFALERLHDRQQVPRVPIYIDSPLTIAITEIYKLHPESLHEDVRARILSRNDPFSPPGLHYVSSVEQSKALQAKNEPCIIIAGSGMCEGGRILHHFVRGIEESKNSVVIVGFMAAHTLGRRLVEGRRKAKVFGVERDVRAEVHVVNGLSAHADQRGLLDFVRQTVAQGRLRKVALVHGEDQAREALAAELSELGAFEVVMAKKGAVMQLVG